MPNHYMISHSLMSNTHTKKTQKKFKKEKNKQTNKQTKKKPKNNRKTNKPTQITSLLQTIHNSDHIIIYHSYL